jgi:thymidine kinase
MPGRLEVITGPMFSGKTEELIRRVMRAKQKGQKVLVFKPQIDTRYSRSEVISHGGLCVEARIIETLPVETLLEVWDPSTRPDVIAIDEAQFFGLGVPHAVNTYAHLGVRVICSGLDLTYQGLPFPPMPELLAYADEVVKLRSVCARCFEDATRTYRLEPTSPEELPEGVAPLTPILVGGAEAYEPRCLPCYTLR